MSLMIKIPKQSIANTSQAAESSRPSRRAKRRQAPVYSDDDDDHSVAGTSEVTRSSKRAKTEERSVGGFSTGDVDAETEVDVGEEDLDADTRFLPPTAKPSRRRGSSVASSQKAKGKASSRKAATKKKRAVVLSDEEGEEEYDESEPEPVTDDDDDFAPERETWKKKPGAKSKGKGVKRNKEDAPIVVKDERKSVPPVALAPNGAPSGKRSHPPEDEESIDVETVTKELSPPPLKKRKLPPIKKNKPPTAASTASSTPSGKPGVKPTTEKDAFALPTPVRKPAATIGNADFDLRDASVYAQLFTKPGGTTPNSGLNRKEKEEERRRELNKMREEARAKRMEEAKDLFDLQAAAEKIQRFEDKLQARKSIAMYPNILGASFKDAQERTKRREAASRKLY